MLEPLAQEMKWDNNIPTYYKHIHSLIIKRQSRRLKNISIDQEVIPRKDLCLFLYDCHIPKEILNYFLEEMQSYNFIEIVDKQNIRIKKLS